MLDEDSPDEPLQEVVCVVLLGEDARQHSIDNGNIKVNPMQKVKRKER